MNSETLVVGRLPLSSNQIYADERADLTKRDLPERPRNLRENISNNRPLSNINNAWRGSFVSDRAVKPKFLNSRTFPPNVPTAHRQPESSETREDHPCSVSEDRQRAEQNPLQAVTTSPKTPIVQSSSPENRSSALQYPLQAVSSIVQSSSQENRSSVSPQAVTASSIVQSSSLPENRPSTSQNPVHAVTTCSIVQQPQVLSPEYADPRRVPGTDQNIYPRAPINPEFHERYPQLVDFFKQAVDTHKFLKYHTSKINYELRLCGSTPSNAVASIIIFCAEALFKDLRSLLNSKHIRRQYQPVNPSLRDRFQFAPSKPHRQASAPIVAPFKIVFWREATTPTQRRSAMEQVVAKCQSFLTMCGSLVRYGDRTSTLGLLISMDSKLYGLTVDHLFKNQSGEEQPTIVNEPDILPDEDDQEDNQADWPWIDDVIYEDMENVGWVSDNGSVTSGQSHAIVTMDHGLTEHYGAPINGHKVDSLCVTDTATPYLDWALIEFDDGYYERPNAFYPEDDPANPKFLGRLSAAPKTSEVNVFMISGVSGTRKGVMLNSNSYIGGKSSENLCQAWNVILSDSGCIIDGDCGSLIVDQETLEVYGHVVASNPLGEAYVVPLQNTFHQISNAFGAKDLSLPNPGLLMESLITHYSKADDSGVADEAKQILASMEGLSSTSSQHDVRDQVRQTPAAWQGLNLNPKVIEELESFGPFSVLIRRLPANTTEDTLRSMVVWSRDFIVAKVLSPEKSEDPGFRSAILRFKSQNGAVEAKNKLNGKPNVANDAQMIVEIFYGSTGSTSSAGSLGEPNQRLSSRFNGTFQTQTSSEFPNPESSTYQSLFSPQSPIGNHLGERTLTDRGPPVSYQLGSQHYQRHSFPPVNPAEQNPPCSTLYVGNLPIDTSEDELKAIFSKQKGFKRLCFRTKQNGPMCFVEFENVSFATKTLNELYGQPLHNSIKGGIRLSFSKNPLGVRSGQITTTPGPMASSFSTASEPPPGFSSPPLRLAPNGMSISGGWNGSAFTSSMATGGPTSMLTGPNKDFPPAYMFGR